MKAMMLHEFETPLKLEEVPKPVPGHNEVLVKVKACGAGLTLTWLRQGLLGGSLPRIIGHEAAGIIEELGSEVTEYSTGQRVTFSFYLFCGRCKFCTEGRESLCENLGGYVGSSIDGAYAEYVKVPARNIVPIPDGVGFEEAGIAADAIATPVHIAKQRAKIKPLDRVLVIGAGGGVGIHMVEVAMVYGAQVIAADIDDGKLNFASEAGANVLVNVKGRDFCDAVLEATGGEGVDKAIDFV